MVAVGGVRVRVSGVLRAAPRTINWVVFGVLPIVIFSWWLLWAVHSPAGDWAFDFRQFWQTRLLLYAVDLRKLGRAYNNRLVLKKENRRQP